MTNPCLKSPGESVSLFAQVFLNRNKSAHLEVREDKCFKPDTWLRIGTITIHPGGNDPQEGELPLEQAIRFGSYSWAVPTFGEITKRVHVAYHDRKRNEQQTTTHNDKTRRALEALMHCAVRCGFVDPIFDAGSVADMPFSRPTTVVVDTSAVLQGGLDFVVRFLYPMARIKIPAITHMEILNMAERYMAHRRSPAADLRVASALLDHVTGQGGQRVLLRLELQTEAEIERPRLGADPLRGIVQPDTDAEDRALGLMQVQRSFADRLILETAIQHRDRLSPDHPIVVLTADQGLARMTLGEGLHALFFCSPPVTHVCGRTLTGTCFRPFIDDMGESPFFHIPLPSVLWELACSFGSARLIADDGSASLVVSSIGEGLSWHPFHSRDDLLWASLQLPEKAVSAATTEMVPKPGGPNDSMKQPHAADNLSSAMSGLEGPVEQHGRKPQTNTLKGSYRFSVDSMLKLILFFERRGRLSDREGMRLIGLATSKRYQDFRNFLLAGQFVEKTDDGLAKLPPLDDLIHAFRALDLQQLKELFLRVPSFAGFLSELKSGHPALPETIKSISQSALTTYGSLSEICCAALDIHGEGVYLTPHSPTPSDFAVVAVESYHRLKGGEDYILTGRWLEELARHYGVHPIRARERLNEARQAGLLERYTEGSTPETQFERHKMAILQLNKGVPSIQSLNLYHGDFLIPGKASVSIRLEEQKT